VLHAVSWVGVQAKAWYCPSEQVEHATQAPPARWNPGAHTVQVEGSLQAAHPAGQAVQAVSVVAVQAAVWYWPALHVVQALHVTPSPVNPGLQAQVKLPAVLEQIALVEQLAVPAAHSSMSTQPPVPPPE
jgi:hypothetical protein